MKDIGGYLSDSLILWQQKRDYLFGGTKTLPLHRFQVF